MTRTESDRASVLTDARRPPGTLDRDAAMVLVRRGVKPADALEEGLAGGGGGQKVRVGVRSSAVDATARACR